MKILRIKACNLASLSGVVELDLQKGALGQAGLFAITGPTGSGKTTLLDAMCLALFDQTPRLQEAGRVKIGRTGQEKDALSAQSPRSLLRHDAGSGYAEVDFESTEGRTFCARWEVRRAGDKPSGRLQNQRMTLRDLVTQELLGSGTKTETKELIVEHLGLNFDQFTRSALLAQGQFASFLKAKRGERAELLERMTGTDLYARISEQAYAKHKAAKEGLSALQAKKDELKLLTPIERAAMQASLDQVRQRVGALEGLERASAKHQSWASQLEQAKESLKLAQAEVLAAEEAWELNAPQRARLARFDSAAMQLERLAELNAASARLHTAQGKHKELKGQLDDAVQAAARAEADLKSCRIQSEAAQRVAAEEGPKIQQAQELGRRAALAHSELVQAQAKLTEAEAQQEGHRASVAELEEALKLSQAAEEEAQGALSGDPQAAALAPHWPRLRRALEEAASLKAQLDTERLSQGDTASLNAQHKQTQVSLTAARAKRQAAQQALQALKAAAPASMEPLTEEVARLERLALSLKGVDQSLGTHKAQRARAVNNTQRLREELHALTARQAQVEAELPAAELAVKDSARLRELGASTLALSQHRHLLTPGEPCPLCGSPEHPGVDPSQVVIDTLTQQERAARTTLEELKLQLKGCGLEAELARKAQEEQAAELSALDRELTQASSAREALLEGFADSEELMARRDSAAEQLRALRLLHEQWRARLHPLESDQERAERELEAAEEAEHQARGALEAARSTAERLAVLEGTWRQAHERLAEELTGLPGFKAADLAQSPKSILQDWAQRVPKAQANALALKESQERARQLQVPLATAQAQLNNAQAISGAARERREQRARAYEEICAAQRALGIADPEAASQALKRAVAESAQALERAAESAQLARATQIKAAEQLRSAQALSQELQLELAQRQQALDEALGPLDLAALTELQAWDEKARGDTRAQNEALQARLQQRVAIHAERSATLARLRADEPTLPVEDQALPPLKERLEQARTERVELELALRDEESRQGQSHALLTEISEHEAANRKWAVISGLIGSSTGDTFRQFAQGLTLESLLAHANQHLHELHPRYVLARVPGEDLELQIIDQDLAGEVRSVNSLSGGETFLTSLALALGLASLSAAQTPVRTLFIDEGFGSLDRDSLDTALATLDALQAGGRQVGIISHVEGIGAHIGVQVEVKRIAPGKSRVLLP